MAATRWHYHQNGIVQVYEEEAVPCGGPRGAGAPAAGRRARRRHPRRRGSGEVPRHRGSAGGRALVPRGRAPRPRPVHARHGGARGARRRGGPHGDRGHRAGAGPRRREARHHRPATSSPTRSCSPPAPGRRSSPPDLGLPLPIEPAKGYSVDVARPADFPEVALYLGDAWTVLTPLGDRLRLGSSLELAGWDMRIRRNRVQRLRVAGERVMGIPADGPVEQIWRGPRPVTPDGLPLVGRVPRRERVIVASAATACSASRSGRSPAGSWPRSPAAAGPRSTSRRSRRRGSAERAGRAQA